MLMILQFILIILFCIVYCHCIPYTMVTYCTPCEFLGVMLSEASSILNSMIVDDPAADTHA